MSYNILATGDAPALVVYLIDISASMNEPLDGHPKISRVNEALERILISMVRRSTKGAIISPRYRLAIAAYSEEVHDLLGGIKPISEVVKLGSPKLSTHSSTNTHLAFQWAKDLLKSELPNLDKCPAPMICHLTDGGFTGDNPAPLAQEIMQMSNPDGHILIENIYIGSDLTHRPIIDVENWDGIFDIKELKNTAAQNLFHCSSLLPESYSDVLSNVAYSLKPGSRMIIPGSSNELIELAFAMSQATPAQ